jgi:hypothetical protein
VSPPLYSYDSLAWVGSTRAMASFSLKDQPEVFLSHTEISQAVFRAVAAGKARKLAGRLYTPNTADTPEEVVRRNRWQVVDLLYPGAVVSHRTALEGGATSDGTIFLTGDYNRIQELPGLTISLRKGPGPLDGDRRFLGKLWMASEARAVLEVLAPSRSKKTVARGWSQEEVEARLERKVRAGGHPAINQLRDRARALAPLLSASREFDLLDRIIGALLGTRQEALSNPVARSRSLGQPYDPHRLELFQSLFEVLKGSDLTVRPDSMAEADFRHLAFFDAYFSNFIEGTEFELDVAKRIVFEGHLPEGRPKDTKDILGSFRVLSRRDNMGESALDSGSGTAFLDLLRERHQAVLSVRDEAGPGRFKEVGNRAGNTVFVDPELVEGTLLRGTELMQGLEDPMARGIFLSVMVSEVHPFADGNGRLARLVMNAELISGGRRRILIPNGYREDYLLALRAFSRQGRTGPLVHMFDRAQAFTAEIDFSDSNVAENLLRRCGAFDDSERAMLRLPSELGLANRDPRGGISSSKDTR